eukprot:TRINITY_DN4288_c0_g1_i1.p1 TRINITY_DN4288_c0_g1~~TRINITY_DN4288_c0_g1_i1.p1  ORF type:complete len:154 (+),score=13.29 TRINITY_DN4288_c0_g1_i1:602-1063(+)
MNISELIGLVTPAVAESARNRELAKSKFDNNEIVGGMAFLIKSAQQGDVGALLTMSTLLYKVSKDCISTKQMAAEYAQEVLKQDPKNKLAKKIINVLKNKPTHKKNDTNCVKNKAILQDYTQNEQNVIALTKSLPLSETKSAEIKLGNNPKVR